MASPKKMSPGLKNHPRAGRRDRDIAEFWPQVILTVSIDLIPGFTIKSWDQSLICQRGDFHKFAEHKG